jgi:hypothetical protein
VPWINLLHALERAYYYEILRPRDRIKETKDGILCDVYTCPFE